MVGVSASHASRVALHSVSSGPPCSELGAEPPAAAVGDMLMTPTCGGLLRDASAWKAAAEPQALSPEVMNASAVMREGRRYRAKPATALAAAAVVLFIMVQECRNYEM